MLLCWLLKELLCPFALRGWQLSKILRALVSIREHCNGLLWTLEEKDLIVLKADDVSIEIYRIRWSVIMCTYSSRIYKSFILAQSRMLSEMWCFPASWHSLHLKNLKFLLLISLQMGKWPIWWNTLQMWGKFSQQIIMVTISQHRRNKGTIKGWETSELFADGERKKIRFMLSNFEYGKMMSPSFPWATKLGCCH